MKVLLILFTLVSINLYASERFDKFSTNKSLNCLRGGSVPLNQYECACEKSIGNFEHIWLMEKCKDISEEKKIEYINSRTALSEEACQNAIKLMSLFVFKDFEDFLRFQEYKEDQPIVQISEQHHHCIKNSNTVDISFSLGPLEKTYMQIRLGGYTNGYINLLFNERPYQNNTLATITKLRTLANQNENITFTASVFSPNQTCRFNFSDNHPNKVYIHYGDIKGFQELTSTKYLAAKIANALTWKNNENMSLYLTEKIGANCIYDEFLHIPGEV